MILILQEFGFESMSISAKDFIKKDLVLQLGAEPLRIDILTSIGGVDNFQEAFSNCGVAEYEELKINFTGYYDLIKNKKSSNRTQDKRDIERDIDELKKVKK